MSSNIIMGFSTLEIVMCVLATALAIILLCKKYKATVAQEGFGQNARYSIKYDADIYDEFYAEIYDKINCPDQKNSSIVALIQQTPLATSDVFLDIGSGTGTMLSGLAQLNYNIFGVDKSSEMVSHALGKYPNLNIKQGDVADSMLYNNSTFSCILVTDLTVYSFKDKPTLFKNIYFWLKLGGFFVVQLCDPDQFNPVAQYGKNQLKELPATSERVTDTELDFINYVYKSEYKFTDGSEIVVVSEKVVDEQTKSVRQNEQTLHMPSKSRMITLINQAGFSLYAEKDMHASIHDKHQYLCIFSKK